MIQEDKEIPLKDICARLPYNLYIRVEEFNVPKNEAITEGFVGNYLKDNRCNDYDADDILNELADGCIDIKPYLRPMSSMTEEEILELYKITYDTWYSDSLYYKNEEWINFRDSIKNNSLCFKTCVWLSDINKVIDWLNAHHFDYRGLIEKGLALEAPEGMYNV